ncbi:MAG: glycosyltransferase family 39 protein [Candidatus Bathyarchaeia archaeon]
MLQYDEAAHSVGGIFLYRIFVGGLPNVWDYLSSYPAITGSFWFYPYGYSVLTSVCFPVLGFSELAARLPSFIFSFLIIHATVCLAKEVEPENRVSIFSAFFAAISSMIIVVGSGAMVDVPLVVLTTYSLTFWIRGLKSRKSGDFLRVGILGGLASLMKPIGFFVLIFILFFALLMFAFLSDRLFLTRSFWKGVLSGFACFSTWWGSALIVNFIVNGWIGAEAIKGVLYWFNFGGIFGGYIPPWDSPPWYKIEAWDYYTNVIIYTMGLMPFVFFCVGFLSRLKSKKLQLVDAILTLFSLTFYILLTFVSNKNPRYIMPILPILHVYAAIGLNSIYTGFNGERDPLDLTDFRRLKRAVTLIIIAVTMINGFLPLQRAITANHVPGKTYGFNSPVKDCLRIVMNDGESGLLLIDSEDNLFNAPVITFYLAAVDQNGRYGCHLSPSEPQEILNLTLGGKKVRYVLIRDLNSSVGRYVCAHPELFMFLGKVESDYINIHIYKVKD